jgi:hypothetical protein
LPNLVFQFPEGIEEVVNERYWDLADKHTRPVLLSEENGLEDRIDLYKILSCIEYTIIGLRPFVAKIDDKCIDYSSETDLNQKNAVHCEIILNGLFAFTTAYNFLKSWKGKYSTIFNDYDIIKLLDEKEDIPHRKTSMTRLDEHIYVLAYSGSSPVWPIFINSTWWRLLCAFSIEISKK